MLISLSRYTGVVILLLMTAVSKAQNLDLKEGDIIFQSNISPQCQAIELATHSKYSHCGIIFKKDNEWMVYEAVQPVQYTALNEWILRNKNHFAIKRLKADSLVTSATVNKMKTAGKKFLGRNYDSYFGWSDESIYCSELVWKIYKEALNMEVGKLQPMREYDLSHPVVKATMRDRYGRNVPLDEPMVSPGNIYNSNLLQTVIEK